MQFRHCLYVTTLTAAALNIASQTAAAQDTPEPRSPAPVVFFDIAGTDFAVQQRFYSEVFAWNIDAGGNFSTSTVSPLPALIRTDPADTVVYLGVQDIGDTLRRVEENGGTIDAPRFEVPGTAVLGLIRDPAGNRVGLVELNDDGTPRIP